jgi:hypothetical protein
LISRASVGLATIKKKKEKVEVTLTGFDQPHQIFGNHSVKSAINLGWLELEDEAIRHFVSDLDEIRTRIQSTIGPDWLDLDEDDMNKLERVVAAVDKKQLVPKKMQRFKTKNIVKAVHPYFSQIPYYDVRTHADCGRYRIGSKIWHNAKAVSTAYDAIVSAFFLAYGQPSDIRGGYNRRIIHQLLHFLTDLVFKGLKHLKEVCHEWRAESMETPCCNPYPTLYRTVSANRLFSASSLARSVPYDFSENEIKLAVKEKEQAWFHKPKPADHSQLKAIRDFSRAVLDDCTSRRHVGLSRRGLQLAQIETATSPIAPPPTTNATVTSSRLKGGCAGDYRRRQDAFNSPDSVWGDLTEEPRDWSLQEIYTIAENTVRYSNTFLFKPLPIVEVGKIRVATLHECDSIHLGRALSGETVPLLARHPWFRAGLTDEALHLTPRTDGPPPEKLKTYSADLTASTEWITQDRAQACIQGVGEALGWSASKILAAMNLLGNQTIVRGDVPPDKQYEGSLREEESSTNSVLLGLGITWTVLSLLNAYCARERGTNYLRDRSFAVCGDDLIGNWSHNDIGDYRRRLRKNDLRSNSKKSFVSSNYGVFCEHRVYRDGTELREDCSSGYERAPQ